MGCRSLSYYQKPVLKIVSSNKALTSKESEKTACKGFFDNLQVIHKPGPIVEETHYYPFGLVMAGISSKAANSLENRRKFNDGTELNSDFDINLYETSFRSLDPQIGRFWQIDPMADEQEQYSPFTYANNNPILLNDPLGLLSDSLNPVQLKEVVVTASKKNKWNYTDWAYFADKNKKWGWSDLNDYLKREGVGEKGLDMFAKAWDGIGYRERKQKIDDEWWEVEEAIAKGIVAIVGGRIVIKVGLRLIPLKTIKGAVQTFSFQAWRVGNNALNSVKRDAYYALAQYFKNNPAKWQNLIEKGDKFIDFTKSVQKVLERGIKSVDDLFK